MTCVTFQFDPAFSKKRNDIKSRDWLVFSLYFFFLSRWSLFFVNSVLNLRKTADSAWLGQGAQTNLKLEQAPESCSKLQVQKSGLGSLFFALSLHRKLHHSYFNQAGVGLGWASSSERDDSSLQGWNLDFRRRWLEFLLVFLIIVHPPSIWQKN